MSHVWAEAMSSSKACCQIYFRGQGASLFIWYPVPKNGILGPNCYPLPHNAVRSEEMDDSCWEVKWNHRDDCVAALMVSIVLRQLVPSGLISSRYYDESPIYRFHGRINFKFSTLFNALILTYRITSLWTTLLPELRSRWTAFNHIVFTVLILGPG